MLVHNLFDVVAFVVAIAHLVHIYKREGQVGGKRWLVITVAGLLMAMGGAVIYDAAEHRSALAQVESRIAAMLRTDARSFDEIFHNLPFSDIPLVSEALGDLVDRGKIGYDVVVLSQRDNSIQHQVGLYHSNTAINAGK
jgi:hypothetical protein